MRLELGTFPVDEVRFESETRWRDGRLEGGGDLLRFDVDWMPATCLRRRAPDGRVAQPSYREWRSANLRRFRLEGALLEVDPLTLE